MKVRTEAPLLDGILDGWRPALGADYAAYRNHCWRVLNFCAALRASDAEALEKTAIAAAFHDLGIWSDGTYDYLAPSRQLAREYLAHTHQQSWAEEIEMMIEHHHKLTRYRPNPNWLVEPFRQADWVDVTRGRIAHGLPQGFVRDVMAAFPDAGFRHRLVALTLQRIKSHPWSPFPMLRL